MSVRIPVTFEAHKKARAEMVNANFQAIAAKFTQGTGGIKNEDCSVQMDLDGAKLSATPGNRVGTTRLEDDAVTADKLKDDPSAGAPNAAVATPAHVKDSIVTWPKLKRRQTTITFDASAAALPALNTFAYDLSSAAPGTGVVVTNPLSSYATYVPIALSISRVGGGVTVPSAELRWYTFVDTATNKIYLCVASTHSSGPLAPLTNQIVVIESIVMS